MQHVETAAADQRHSGIGDRVRPVAEEHHAPHHRHRQRHVLERRNDGWLGDAVCLRHQVAAYPVDDTDAEEQRGVRDGGNRPRPQQKGETRVALRCEAPVARDEAESNADRDESRLRVEGDGGGPFGGPEPARDDLHQRVRACRDDRQQGHKLQGARAGTQHHDHAHESDADRRPAARTDRVAQHERGQRGDQQRRDEEDRRRLGNRHRRQRQEERGIGDDQQPRAREVQAEAAGAQQMDAAFEPHHEQGDAYRAGRADQHDLVQGIVAAQPFDERILQDEDGDRPDDAGDPECPLVHSSRALTSRAVPVRGTASPDVSRRVGLRKRRHAQTARPVEPGPFPG